MPFYSCNEFLFRRKADSQNSTKGQAQPKRKKQTQKKVNNIIPEPVQTLNTDTISDGHMTAEEVERHLQSRQSLIGLVPEVGNTVPTEMFSNEPSLDR